MKIGKICPWFQSQGVEILQITDFFDGEMEGRCLGFDPRARKFFRDGQITMDVILMGFLYWMWFYIGGLLC